MMAKRVGQFAAMALVLPYFFNCQSRSASLMAAESPMTMDSLTACKKNISD